MRTRVAWITTKRSGARAVREVFLDSERLRVGRGTDADLQLPGLSVALDHAVLERRGAELWAELTRGDDLRVNGRVAASRALVAGDTLRIGAWELRVVPPAEGVDLALEVEEVPKPEGEGGGAASRLRMGIAGVMPRRLLGWGAALLTAVVVFAWPVATERAAPPFDASSPRVERSPLAPVLASVLATGPVSESHAHFGDRCRACHAEAFEKVPDAACLACHEGIGAHAARSGEAAAPVAGGAVHVLADAACVECHREHGTERTLAAFPDSLCVDCHREDLGQGEERLLGAADFATAHPELRPMVVVGSAPATRRRSSLADVPREDSGLRFPHDRHLVDRLKAPDGEVSLACADCHMPDPSGSTMRPIAFEEHCRRCHSLGFDERHPGRQALHASPDALAEDLFEFFATAALRGAALDEAAPEVARRRPGRDLTEAERESVLAWVASKTTRVTRLLLDEEGACADCHVLRREDGGVRVEPVRLVPFEGAPRWLERARFRHEDHASADCSSCHAAKDSRESADVLLPGIARCRDCHGGGEPRLGRRTSPCVQCHDFHRTRFGAMRGSADAGAAPRGPRG